MTLEAFRTVFSFETQDTFLPVRRIQVYVVPLKMGTFHVSQRTTDPSYHYEKGVAGPTPVG